MQEVKRLSTFLHGFSGVGKTPVSNTAPGPRLMIDVENTSKWLKNHKVYWDGKSPALELQGLTEDTTVVVKLPDYNGLNSIMQYLISGRHPFRSVMLDSLTELQLKMMTAWAGHDKREYDHWNKLLIWCEDLCIKLKDLTEHPTNPVDCVIVVCGSVVRDGRTVPLLDGSFKNKASYKFDLIAYMSREEDASGQDHAVFRIQPTPSIDAKDRTQILAPYYGTAIERPDFMEIMRVLNTEPANA